MCRVFGLCPVFCPFSCTMAVFSTKASPWSAFRAQRHIASFNQTPPFRRPGPGGASPAMIDPFAVGENERPWVDQTGGDPAHTKTCPVHIDGMQTAEQKLRPYGSDDRRDTIRNAEPEITEHEASRFIITASEKRSERNDQCRPFHGVGAIQQEGERPEGADHRNTTARLVFAVQQHPPQGFEIQ